MKRLFSSLFGGVALCSFAWMFAALFLGAADLAIVCAIACTIGAILCAVLDDKKTGDN